MIELEENSVLSVGASDVLSGLFQNKPSECFVIDLRDDEEMKSGSIPMEMNVAGSVWKKDLMLEGVLRYLEEIKGQVAESGGGDV